jgi:hypothetical protein
MVWRAAGRGADPERCPARDGDVSRMVLDIRRAFDVLGWWPMVGLPEGIEAVVAATSRDLHLIPGVGPDTPPRPADPQVEPAGSAAPGAGRGAPAARWGEL